MKTILTAFIFIAFYSYASAQTPGCTDPKSPKYNPSATENDGSCTYGVTNYNPVKISNLPTQVKETSGLMLHNDVLWTHNDGGNAAVLYALNKENGSILRTVQVSGASNIDWEDITKDDTYGYIGDFGNNNGNRTNLRILRFPLSQLESDTVFVEIIQFSYPDQTDFSSKPQNNDFDAEALISVGDSLYIFSKNWVNLRTKLYVLPKEPGIYTARLDSDMYANGLITGATFNQVDSVILLTGYTRVLTPIMWMFWDFRGGSVFNGNKRKININLPLHQIEAAEWISGNDYLITNEAFESLGNVPAAMFRVNTDAWISTQPTGFSNSSTEKLLNLFPNPAIDSVTLIWTPEQNEPVHIRIFQTDGRLVRNIEQHPNTGKVILDIKDLSPGTYWVFVREKAELKAKFIRQP
jgi:hypothetical protein